MIPCEMLCRVFRLRVGTITGSTFTMEKDGMQYLVTARHVFEHIGFQKFATIDIFINGEFCPVNVHIAYNENPNIDIAVMKTDPYIEMSPKYTNENTIIGVTLGQKVFFLGFPYEYDSLLQGFPGSKTPIPFIKKACISGLAASSEILYLDGINNPGFSGGPVCFKDVSTGAFKIAGIISGYRFSKSSVFGKDGGKTDYYVRENTGIINAYSISYALKAIEQFQEQ